MGGFKKILFLFLALLLPVVVFVFLKLFGQNEFAVQPLFQEAVEPPQACTSFVYKTPYTISDSILTKLGWNSQDSVTLFIFDDKIRENRIETLGQIERITQEFSSEKISVQCVVENGESNWLNNLGDRINVAELMPEAFPINKNCVFLLKESDNAVLVDSKKRIRGQYNLTNLEDADRLFVHELNILFNRY
jgi:hypothetical protein